jgi:hypothetical protein
MPNTTSQASRATYRVPYTYAEARVSLDDFSIEDMIEHIQNRGDASDIEKLLNPKTSHPVGGEPVGLFIHQADLNTAETLLLCGQRAEAQDVIFELVSKHIGRKL